MTQIGFDDWSGGSRTASEDTVYAELFQRYTENTDGKELLARAIVESQRKDRRRRLLDLGAGDGSLTRLVANHFDQAVAVERNPRFESSLAAIQGCDPRIERIEGFRDDGTFDLILLSYSLTGIDPAKVRATLTYLASLVSPGGRLLACTFDDGSDWAKFAHETALTLGTKLRGGGGHYEQLIVESGFVPRLVQQANTTIWDKSLDSLQDLMGFFFINDIESYREHQSDIAPLLVRHARYLKGRWAIRVIENLYRIA